MLILITSPDALLHAGKPDQEIIGILKKAKADHNPVGLISNHTKPDWFDINFEGTKVQFLQVQGRQKGEIIGINAKKFNLDAFDVLVLAAKDVDVQMGKNGGAVLIAAGWSTDTQVVALGIRVDNALQLEEVIDLTTSWPGQWWFSGNSPKYKVRALADLSGINQVATQQELAKKLTNTVKNGGSRLNALLAITARSLLKEGTGSVKDLLWGVYPSSKSKNDDSEILSEFTHRLRTTVSRVRYASIGQPLFIRHKPSPKRSLGGTGDRTDPKDQILTIHLNPFYLEKNRLRNKHVIVVDDCTTYGVSFGVASAFLLKAGAASVTGVALGKFGNQLRSYDIAINSDPYAPVVEGGYTSNEPGWLTGSTSNSTKHTLQNIIA